MGANPKTNPADVNNKEKQPLHPKGPSVVFKKDKDGALVVDEAIQKLYDDGRGLITIVSNARDIGIKMIDCTSFSDKGAWAVKYMSDYPLMKFKVDVKQKEDIEKRVKMHHADILASDGNSITFVPFPELEFTAGELACRRGGEVLQRFVEEYFEKFKEAFYELASFNGFASLPSVKMDVPGVDWTKVFTSAKKLGMFAKPELVDAKLNFGNTALDLENLAKGWNDIARAGEQKLILLEGVNEKSVLIIKRFKPKGNTNEEFAKWLTAPIPGEETYMSNNGKELKKTPKYMLINTLWSCWKNSFPDKNNQAAKIVIDALEKLSPDKFVFTKWLNRPYTGDDIFEIKEGEKSFLRSQKNEKLIYEIVSGVLSPFNEARVQKFGAALKKIIGVDLARLRTSYVTVKDVQSLLIHFLCHPSMDLDHLDNKVSIVEWSAIDWSKD